MTATRVFLLALLFGLLVQTITWRHTKFLDQDRWIEATAHLSVRSDQMYDPFLYGYPGTAPMVLAVAIHRLSPVSIAASYIGSISILVAIAAAGTATTAYLMASSRLWPLTIPPIIASNTLLFSATPPSLVVAPFLVWMNLLVLYLSLRYTVLSRWHALFFGAIWGVVLATRLDIGLAMGGLLIAVLGWRFHWRILPYSVLAGIVVCWLLNPFLWLAPIDFVSAFFAKFFYHYFEHTYGRRVLPLRVVQDAAFALISMMFAVLALVRSWWFIHLPRWFISFLFLQTALIVLILIPAKYHAVWYLTPLILLWEVFLPLFILELTSHIRVKRKVFLQRMATTVIVSTYCLLMVLNLFLDSPSSIL